MFKTILGGDTSHLSVQKKNDYLPNLFPNHLSSFANMFQNKVLIQPTKS